jgi:cytochrome c-type protein NapC
MNDDKKSKMRKLLDFLKKPSAKYSLFSLVFGGFFFGIIFWGGFHTALEATNTMEFCIGCHEMRDTVYQEYKETIHYSNRTGVRAICSDCHVPKDWSHKMLRKAKASFEVWGMLTGSINTKEKFEAKRMEMATHEWERMKASGSRECKNCHSFDGMNAQKQKPKAQKNHEQAQKEGKTCIDCHKGIAHLLPREYTDPEEA